MTRLHPFEHVFGPVAATWFPAIREEARASGRDLSDRADFARLTEVAARLEELSDDTGEGELEEYLRSIHAAYRFWAAGEPTLAVTRGSLDPRLDDPAASPPTVPQGACYLQFPERWFWSRLDQTAPHEPLDGLFLQADRGGREVQLIAVLGLRPDRSGFSQISASAAARDFADAALVAAPPRFHPAMDGGALAGFRSVRSVAELLVLASLALATASE